MISSFIITEIFCSIDDFCKEFEPLFEHRLLGKGKKRNKPCKLSLLEVMTVQVLFHLSGIVTFKKFYLAYLKTQGSGHCSGVSF